MAPPPLPAPLSMSPGSREIPAHASKHFAEKWFVSQPIADRVPLPPSAAPPIAAVLPAATPLNAHSLSPPLISASPHHHALPTLAPTPATLLHSPAAPPESSGSIPQTLYPRSARPAVPPLPPADTLPGNFLDCLPSLCAMRQSLRPNARGSSPALQSSHRCDRSAEPAIVHAQISAPLHPDSVDAVPARPNSPSPRAPPEPTASPAPASRPRAHHRQPATPPVLHKMPTPLRRTFSIRAAEVFPIRTRSTRSQVPRRERRRANNATIW